MPTECLVAPKEPRLRIDTDLFRGSDAVRCGLITERQLRSEEFRRIFRDVYAKSTIPITHELCCRAAVLVVSEDAVITGRSAATIWGVPLASVEDPVELIVSRLRRSHRRPGLAVRCVSIAEHEYQSWQGIHLATPVRAAFDVLVSSGLDRAIPNVNALLHAGIVDLFELERFLVSRHDHGITQARKAMSLLDKRAALFTVDEIGQKGVADGGR